MAGRELDPAEIAAGKLIAQMLGGRAVPTDVKGAPEKTVDFRIDLPNLWTVALEITSAADSDVVSQLRAAFGNTWSSPELAHNWMVGLSGSDPKQNIRRLMDVVIPLAVMFERDGETGVEVRYDPRYRPKPDDISHEMHEARLTMFDNGVYAARKWNAPEAGKHGEIFLTMSAGVSSDAGLLNDLVVERAEKKVDKLRAAEADERHLFIWLDSSYPEAELAFATLPPPQAPAIPNGIDVLWLVEPTGWPDHVRIWRLRGMAGEWEVIEPPEGYTLGLDRH